MIKIFTFIFLISFFSNSRAEEKSPFVITVKIEKKSNINFLIITVKNVSDKSFFIENLNDSKFFLSIGEKSNIPLKKNYSYTKKSSINGNWSLCFLSKDEWGGWNERTFKIPIKGMLASETGLKTESSILFGYCDLKSFEKKSFKSFKYKHFKCVYEEKINTKEKTQK